MLLICVFCVTICYGLGVVCVGLYIVDMCVLCYNMLWVGWCV